MRVKKPALWWAMVPDNAIRFGEFANTGILHRQSHKGEAPPARGRGSASGTPAGELGFGGRYWTTLSVDHDGAGTRNCWGRTSAAGVVPVEHRDILDFSIRHCTARYRPNPAHRNHFWTERALHRLHLRGCYKVRMFTRKASSLCSDHPIRRPKIFNDEHPGSFGKIADSRDKELS